MAARIMLADDLAFIKMVEKDALEKMGYKVVCDAKDGVEAVKLYQEMKPDVVIMDITMPKMDGLNALKAIMQYDHGAKVIMCSALGQQKLIVEAIKLGAKDFIVKPFKPERIISALQKVLGAG